MIYIDKFIFPFALAFMLFTAIYVQYHRRAAISTVMQSVSRLSGSIDEVKSGQRNIRNSVDDLVTYYSTDDITTFTGITNSDLVTFGHPKYCEYSLQMRNIELRVTIDWKRRKVRSSALSSTAVQTVLTCPFKQDSLPAQIQLSQLDYSTLVNDSIQIYFRSEAPNFQNSSVTFSGIVEKKAISGTLVWERNSAGPDSMNNFRLACPINASGSELDKKRKR